MKFTCNSKDIASAVSAASKIVNTHTTVPILSNVLLQSEDGRIIARATDLELTLELSFSGKVSEPGSVTLPAKLLSSYLANLPAAELELSGTPTRATVKCERSNYDFHALPADEYPPLPGAPHSGQLTISAKRFRDGIDATIFAASSEEARGAVLMGTLMEVDGDSLTLVATDGYRLARHRTSLSSGAKGQERYIVPSRALAEAARNLGGSEEITIGVLGSGNNQLALSAGEMAITVRLVDGQYPNYQQVIPAKFDRSATVNTAALLGSLRRAELVAGDRASMVKLAIANQTLVVTASSDISGNAYEELEVEQQGEDLTIAFNARYLIDVLNHVKSPRALLEFLGPLSPAAIRPADGEEAEQLYILMPLRQ